MINFIIAQSLLEIPFAKDPQEISIRKPERINVSEIYVTKEIHLVLDRGKYQSISQLAITSLIRRKLC